jgi:hypothetical protein
MRLERSWSQGRNNEAKQIHGLVINLGYFYTFLEPRDYTGFGAKPESFATKIYKICTQRRAKRDEDYGFFVYGNSMSC